MPALLPTEPMPRMRMLVERVSVTGMISRLGTKLWSSLNVVTPASRRVSPLRAVMEMGTVCRVFARLLAVTTISSIPPALADSGSPNSASADSGRSALPSESRPVSSGPGRKSASCVPTGSMESGATDGSAISSPRAGTAKPSTTAARERAARLTDKGARVLALLRVLVQVSVRV